MGTYRNQRSASSAAPAAEADSTEILYLPTAQGLMPVAAQIKGRLYAIHTDHLNTPRRLTNQQGQVAWQWLLTGFGEASPTTGAQGYVQGSSAAAGTQPSYAPEVVFNLRYPGQQWDEETGLAYNVNRYYDATSGRYIQADPIGMAGGWNRFGYVGGNPLNNTDPDGLVPLLGPITNAASWAAMRLQGLHYRYGPAITEFIAGASGVNGSLTSPAAVNPLVAQIPMYVSRMTPVATGITQAVKSGAFCAAPKHLNVGGALTESEKKLLRPIWDQSLPTTSLSPAAREAISWVYEQTAANNNGVVSTFNLARAAYLREEGPNPGRTLVEYGKLHNLPIPGKRGNP